MSFSKFIRPALLACGLGLFFATPALAVDGRTAVGMCIDSTANGSRCAWSVNDKGEIDICNKSGCVYCPSATEQCSVARRRPRPTRPMPVGSEVRTPLGEFTVGPRAFEGDLLRAPARPGAVVTR
ncbi:hypothetical protein [Siccirubricoccus phaeus]|uniref:hypothetical protein n=1 Tax=Siccirubricoccus phaeus TaxID=2595053 RepID=UPI0011F156AE|nr:hypothetical protein [Siccirubricoccus phaeus]